ncbi:hypothetical protein UCRPC4_g00619 [Phaeomoniella chlamydospora]|uniref:Uncharacterized protein n=1 Tax=Phaeomoniella chlamydospora TaxID=158046 RepID=A0A0G2HJC4_PHACM|nr:hypothetical protein UCRPC4_g00619 [Phaeomoniella chlamydospora]
MAPTKRSPAKWDTLTRRKFLASYFHYFDDYSRIVDWRRVKVYTGKRFCRLFLEEAVSDLVNERLATNAAEMGFTLALQLNVLIEALRTIHNPIPRLRKPQWECVQRDMGACQYSEDMLK